MKRVILESPFAGKTPQERSRHLRYARACVRDCLLRDEAPFASHLLYTQPGILRDNVVDERALGMKAGLTWTPAAEGVRVYQDFGVSLGMQAGISRALNHHLEVEYRNLSPDILAIVNVDDADDGNPLAILARGDLRREAQSISPMQLTDVLRAVGIDMTCPRIIELCGGPEDVVWAHRWATEEARARQGERFDRTVSLPPFLEDAWRKVTGT